MRLHTPGLAAAALSLTLACQGGESLMSEHHHPANTVSAAKISGEVQADVARLRALVASLRQLETAQAAGFVEAASPCVASPMGGMGFHWANPGRVNATVQWDEPEVLVFAPHPDAADGVKLAAVEYIVPKALSTTAPVLFGETFVEGGPENSLWTLHVWIGIHNPDGLFAVWNPRVSCP
jgi:hypothetical protein